MLGYRSDEWIVYNKKTCCNGSICINFLLFLNIISSSWSKTIFINYLTRCWGKKSSLRSCLVFGFVFIFLVFFFWFLSESLTGLKLRQARHCSSPPFQDILQAEECGDTHLFSSWGFHTDCLCCWYHQSNKRKHVLQPLTLLSS